MNARKHPQSKEFKAWFRESQVVDTQGNPLICYHSTKSDFAAFELSSDIGFHFGTAQQAANRAMTQGNDRTIPVYLSIQRPIELPDLGDWEFWRFTEDGLHSAYYEIGDGRLGRAFGEAEIDLIAEKLANFNDDQIAWEWMRKVFEGKGFDGIKYQNVGETEDHEAGDFSYIAFRSHQIKLAIGRERKYDRSSSDFTL